MMSYSLRGACVHCTRPVDGLGHQAESGELYHLSCWESSTRVRLVAFEVTVHISETRTVIVAATDENEAEQIACDQLDLEEPFADFEVHDVAPTGAAPDDDAIDAYERFHEKRLVMKPTARPASHAAN